MRKPPGADGTISPDRLAVLLQLTLGTLFLAGIIHILSVLAMPIFAPDDAYSRVASLVPVNGTNVFPRPRPGEEVFPFSDPAIAVAVCRFDLATAPLRITAPLKMIGEGFLSISFHDRRGTVFYAVTDKAATRGAIEVAVYTPTQREGAEAADSEDEQPRELRVTAPSLTGFVMFRSLAVRPSAYAAVEDQLTAITCTSEGASPGNLGASLTSP
jgi:uncharacterized membrane protein